MGALGSGLVADNDVTLTASSLPPNQFGIFAVAPFQGFVPGTGGTSNGNLCLAGSLGRYVGPGEILSSGAAGEFQLAIDLQAIPQGGGTAGTSAGQTWNFQAWFRDRSASARTSRTGSRSRSSDVNGGIDLQRASSLMD